MITVKITPIEPQHGRLCLDFDRRCIKLKGTPTRYTGDFTICYLRSPERGRCPFLNYLQRGENKLSFINPERPIEENFVDFTMK